MRKTTLNVELSMAEFMLDLPEGIRILGATVKGGYLEFEIESEHDFIDGGVMTFDISETTSNTCFTGVEPM